MVTVAQEGRLLVGGYVAGMHHIVTGFSSYWLFCEVKFVRRPPNKPCRSKEGGGPAPPARIFYKWVRYHNRGAKLEEPPKYEEPTDPTLVQWKSDHPETPAPEEKGSTSMPTYGVLIERFAKLDPLRDSNFQSIAKGAEPSLVDDSEDTAGAPVRKVGSKALAKAEKDNMLMNTRDNDPGTLVGENPVKVMERDSDGSLDASAPDPDKALYIGEPEPDEDEMMKNSLCGPPDKQHDVIFVWERNSLGKDATLYMREWFPERMVPSLGTIRSGNHSPGGLTVRIVVHVASCLSYSLRDHVNELCGGGAGECLC